MKSITLMPLPVLELKLIDKDHLHLAVAVFAATFALHYCTQSTQFLELSSNQSVFILKFEHNLF